MADLAGQVRELARVFADSGMSILQAVSHRGGMALRKFDSAGGQGGDPVSRRAFRASSSNSGDLFTVLRGLDDLLRPAGEDRALAVELRLDDTGGHELSYTFELETISPTRLVLDPDYRYPQHPRPGMPKPAGAGVTDRRTDPAVLATVRELTAEFVARYTKIKGRGPDLGTGYTEAQILAAENALGLRLPEDLRALYRNVRGDAGEHGLLGAQSLLSLDDVVTEYHAGGPGMYGWNDDLFTVEPVVFDAYPAGRVRRLSRSDWWVTIATDFGGGWCAVDLDPAPGGTPGQLIEYGRHIDGPVGYLAESVTDLLRQVLDALRTGKHENDDPDSPRPETTARVGSSNGGPYSEAVPKIGRRSVADVVAGLADPDALQQLYLNDAGTLHLAELAPLTSLREISVTRATSVDLTLPHRMPVESLSVDATAADLAPLAGHPTLWHLTLKNLAEPVSVEALTALPALTYLNLSAVEVTDLERVATLTQLRVLVLNQRQWQHLRDRDALPGRLAAAELAGYAPLADALDWTTWLRTHP